MTPAIAALLGAIQGLTEFLPVSSSGHVALGAVLFHLEDLSIGAVLIVHIGTLLATLVVLRKDVISPAIALATHLTNPMATAQSREAIGILVGTLPTAIIGLVLRHWVEEAANAPTVIALAFVVTAALLLTTRAKLKERPDLPMWVYFFIGVVQGFAVFPGISRSGSTIAAAMLVGVPPAAAFRVSFLLSIPAIAGATLLEASGGGLVVDTPALISGVVAFVTGWAALLLLRSLVTLGRLWWFALYLIPLAVLTFLMG